MKKSLTNFRPLSNTNQAGKAFCKRMEQDFFLIRKMTVVKTNLTGIEPIIATRIERIIYAINVCKMLQPKLQNLLGKYMTLYISAYPQNINQ